jgi:hypothetical protein
VYTVPTTTISILRGTSTDVYGDLTDTATVAASGIPASIIEQRKTVFTPADNRVQQVGFFTGRVSQLVDVRIGDRIQDERTGTIYVLDNISTVSSPALGNDSRLDLRKAS